MLPAGGEPESLTTPDQEKGEMTQRWPYILPRGATVFFTIQRGTDFEIAVFLWLLTSGRNIPY